MFDKDVLVSQALETAKLLELTNINPTIISDGGNLIVHLAPYSIIARIANVISVDDVDLAYRLLTRELQVARHLHLKGIPVVLPAINSGPHKVDSTWMTLWSYIPPTALEPLSPELSVRMVNDLSLAMEDFPGSVPTLGIWDRACQAARELREQSDPRIQNLLAIFARIDKQMRTIKPEFLFPTHGDAHARNLLPSLEGWLWIDFEDVSLMPLYWDLASFVGNLVLFGGTQEPIYQYMLSHKEIVADREAFGLALTARTLMATLSNLAYAFAGHGDLEYATHQLELAGSFLSEIRTVE